MKIGSAQTTLTSLEQTSGPNSFDFAFVDANKVDYDSYYECALRLFRPAGVIALDNMFFRGSVVDPEETGPLVSSIRRLNDKIAADERVDRVVLPVGDGMTLVRRR